MESSDHTSVTEGTMRTEAAPMSLAEYAALHEPGDRHTSELVRGVLVREPRPGRAHGRIQSRLAGELDRWSRAVGAEVTTESGYVLADDPPTLRGPDVAVVREPETVPTDERGWVRGAPDLAVEILSPRDTSTAIQGKTLDYLKAGARLVWVVDPLAHTLTVYRPDGSARLLREDDALDGEDVLDGFALPLSVLFGTDGQEAGRPRPT